MDVTIAFETPVPHGLCVGVHFPDRGPIIRASGGLTGEAVPVELSEDERRHAGSLHPGRRPSWVAGRMALRTALARLGAQPGAILADDRGAPVMPEGVVGSISHKAGLAVALAAADTGWRVGVDVERRTPPGRDISRRVLTRAELNDIAELAGAARHEAVLLRFSLKEAVYKAVDPFVRRYVGFREVEVSPGGDGRAAVRHDLEQPLCIEAWWTRRDDVFLTGARARPATGSGR